MEGLCEPITVFARVILSRTSTSLLRRKRFSLESYEPLPMKDKRSHSDLKVLQEMCSRLQSFRSRLLSQLLTILHGLTTKGFLKPGSWYFLVCANVLRGLVFSSSNHAFLGWQCGRQIDKRDEMKRALHRKELGPCPLKNSSHGQWRYSQPEFRVNEGCAYNSSGVIFLNNYRKGWVRLSAGNCHIVQTKNSLPILVAYQSREGKERKVTLVNSVIM